MTPRPAPTMLKILLGVLAVLVGLAGMAGASVGRSSNASPGPQPWCLLGCTPHRQSSACGQALLPHGAINSGSGGMQIPFIKPKRPGIEGRPETFTQYRLIQLENARYTPVTLDRVCLVPGPRRSRLELGGERVTKGAPNWLFSHWRGTSRGVVPLAGYRLAPNKALGADQPALDLLLGPSRRPGPYACSGNAAFQLLYHSPDGTEYQTIFFFSVEFPNSADTTADRCNKTYNPWLTFQSAYHVQPTATLEHYLSRP